jgi:hypothetical protein
VYGALTVMARLAVHLLCGRDRYVGAGSRFRQPQVSLQSPGVASRVATCPLDPSDVEARMWSLSSGFSELPRTGTAVITYS